MTNLIKHKQQFETKYSNNYDKNCQSKYNEYRINYYKQILQQYFKSGNVSTINQNQFQISIAFKPLLNIYCEIKPILGDDYPCVLRKMNTQISATEMKIGDKEYNRYVLLVDKFESSVTTDEQLIEIFKQSNIRVIFANQIIPEIQLNQRDNVSTLVTYQPAQPAQPITQQTQPISVTNANEIIQALQRKIEEQEKELKIY